MRSMTKCITVCFLVLGVSRLFAQDAGRTIDDCQYANTIAAQRAWLPTPPTAEPVKLAIVDGLKGIRMRCDFAGSKAYGARWDRQVDLDLRQYRAIQLKLHCKNPAPISRFLIYFESAAGWYSPQTRNLIKVESTTGWNTIVIEKDDYSTPGEKTPIDWGKIKGIRISANRGKSGSTEFCITDIRAIGSLGADASIAILSSESSADLYSAAHWAGVISKDFVALGIGHSIIGDVDVSTARLKKAKIAILPPRIKLPDGAVDDLIEFVNTGGKLLLFWELPARLQTKIQPVVKIEYGKFVREKYSGQFSTIGVADGALPGAPARVDQVQKSSFLEVRDVVGASETLAAWLDGKGQPTGYAAIVASENCLVCTPPWITDTNTRRALLQAMIGRLGSDPWQRKANDAVARLGQMAGCKTFDEIVALITRTGASDRRIKVATDSARQHRNEAVALMANKQYQEATKKTAAATQRLIEAFSMMQQPVVGEFRSFWAGHIPPEGMDWDTAIKWLADNGFNAIFPNMCSAFATFYPSRVLPVHPMVAERGDQLAQCLAACKKYRVQMHLTRLNWSSSYYGQAEFTEQMRRAGRLQVDDAGEEGTSSLKGKVQHWLCPSHPENLRLEIAAMLEIVRNYDVDGIGFDTIRYPTDHYCFCDGCRARFMKATGLNIKNWPQDAVRGDGKFHKQWLEWRRNNITALVKAASEQIRATKPRVKISAAVWSDWSTVRDTLGQDWRLWCERGWLDFVMPMNYMIVDWKLDTAIGDQQRWAGRVPVYPIILASLEDGTMLPVDRVINQIQIIRRHRTQGFAIFGYGTHTARDLVPMLGLGISAKR